MLPTTTTTTTYGFVLVLLLVLSLLAEPPVDANVDAAEKLIPFDDGNIKYFGRWQLTEHDMRSNWPGAYFKTNVYGGRSIKLRLNQPTHIYVQLDEGPVRQFIAKYTGAWPIQVDVAPADLTDDHQHQLVVAAAANATICLESLVLDMAGDTTPPANVSPQLVEFVGHDLALGVGTSQSLLTGFPWMVSTLIGAEHAQIAYSRARLMNDTTILGMETRYFDWSPHELLSDGDPWDFSSYVPAAIVVLLGQNDYKENEYTDTLVGFLKRIRTHLHYTSILVLSEPLGDLVRQSQDAVYQLNDQGDQNVFFVDTTGWVQYGSTAFADSMHLNDAGQDRLARKLAPLLTARLSTPPQPLPGPPPNPSLPHDWQTMDVGEEDAVGLPGSVSFDSPHTFTLWGSGIDIGNGGRDAFRFVYQALSADGAIEATVVSHSAFASCAKAGIMMREHLALGSPHVMLGISPANGIFVQTRSSNFNQTRLVKKLRASPPYRFRLVRKGTDFIAQASVDNGTDKGGDDGGSGDEGGGDASGGGRTDDEGGQAPVTEWQTLANMTDLLFARDIYVGLAVTSCDPSVVSVAKFADISLSGGVGNGFYSSSSSSSPTSQQQQQHPRLINQQ
ncbi:hypothetical protein BDB00DRAFT_831333 [Zychaea mexicana]|uniref:uncharacterized protein n=1 Tax=Zychaea mexicana TaxID=64656 RepID=UPI0022FDE0D6|nr:uncharacterized protein BDB00DRAFT_831333 [Zychaea mexicana]KAI9491757.1 hypothetical protein BDB00DRAFT_831333 [Zychaea mexicana]